MTTEEMLTKSVESLRAMCAVRGLDWYNLAPEHREILIAAFQEGIMFAKELINEKM